MTNETPSIKMVTLESVTLIGMSCSTTKAIERKKSKIMKLSRQFWSRSGEIPNRLDSITYGVSIYPEQYTGFEPYEHMIGFQVKPSEETPEGMVKRTFPAQLYAVATNKGEIGNLFRTYGYFHSKWLPASGYEYAHSYDVQLYDSRFLGVANPESEIDIYFPVRLSGSNAVVHPGSPITGRLHAAFIPVRDINAAKTWYSRILGLPESGGATSGHYLLPLDGGTDLVLDEMKLWREREGEEFPSYKAPAFMLATADIEEAYRFMKEQGVHLVTGIEDDKWFVFRDPDGNLLMVCE